MHENERLTLDALPTLSRLESRLHSYCEILARNVRFGAVAHLRRELDAICSDALRDSAIDGDPLDRHEAVCTRTRGTEEPRRHEPALPDKIHLAFYKTFFFWRASFCPIRMAGLDGPGPSKPSLDGVHQTRLHGAFAEVGSRVGSTIWKTSAAVSGLTARPSELGFSRGWTEELLNLFACGVIVVRVMTTPDAILGVAIGVACTLVYWFYAPNLHVNMSWNVVSLAVIFPISQGIAMGFRRREDALHQFGQLSGCMIALWGAAFTWTVAVEGEQVRVLDRFADPAESRRALHNLAADLLTALVAYFDVKRWGRARQTLHCCGGKREQQELMAIAHEQRLVVDSGIAKLRHFTQALKARGLPGGEVHRLDSYVMQLGVAFERLTYLKEYRTPQAFRAFARVYTLFFGMLYGPYYVHLGRGASQDESNIGLSIAFAIAMQLAMSGLLNVFLGMEDPFYRTDWRGPQFDAIRVPEIVEIVRRQLLRIEREANRSWAEPLCKEPWCARDVGADRLAAKVGSGAGGVGWAMGEGLEQRPASGPTLLVGSHA